MTKRILALTLFAFALPGLTAFAQQEGPTPTQALVSLSSKTPVSATAKDVTLKVDNRTTNLLNLAPIPPNGAQVALLIDDGLRTSIGGELNNLKAFITSLPQGTEVFVGYMQNGRVVSANDMPSFSADRAAVAQGLRICPWACPAPAPAPTSASPTSSRTGPPASKANPARSSSPPTKPASCS